MVGHRSGAARAALRGPERSRGTRGQGEHLMIIRAVIVLYALTTAAVVVLHALVTLASDRERR
jgi:hypothetical protein